MVYARIAALLKDKIGLDAESIGITCVERAVRERLIARALTDVQAYWQELCAAQEELQELIDAIVIPETWFFRDPEAFAALVRVVREDWLTSHRAETLRLLSLPCSTGEEPFSMAMALLDGGLPPPQFRIDAIDISTRAIAAAQEATYGKNSFRTRDLGFRERYFEPVERGYRLSESVRRQVHFRHGNLLSPGWPHAPHGYEVIFCRNVLIYFDRATQDHALDVLGRLLTPSGLLFVGPSESGLLLDHGFVPARIPLAFAFRRAGNSAPKPNIKRRAVPAALVPKPLSALPRRPASMPPPAPVQETLEATVDWIEQARQLANQGKVTEALAYCEHHLRGAPASAETFHLIGLLHDAAGRVSEAAVHYRKALYLDPQHREALVHLAVVLQKEGDVHGARRLLARANRQLGRDENTGGG